MKRLLIIAGSVLCALFISAATFTISSDYFTGHFPWDSSLPEGVIHAKLSSVVLGEERDIIIHYPLNYDSTVKYPVMYVLDGGSDDSHIANKLDVLTAAGYARQTIVVGIPNMTAENRKVNLVPPFMRTDPEDVNSPLGGADKFLLFLEKELFPFIENNFSGSQERAISGNSRGALLAMYSLLYKPNLFQARFCYSGPYWRQDQILVSKVSDLLNSTDTLRTFLYMSAGADETENMRAGLAGMTQAFRDKAPSGFVWYSDLTPNATHQNNGRISAAIGIARWSEHLN